MTADGHDELCAYSTNSMSMRSALRMLHGVAAALGDGTATESTVLSLRIAISIIERAVGADMARRAVPCAKCNTTWLTGRELLFTCEECGATLEEDGA